MLLSCKSNFDFGFVLTRVTISLIVVTRSSAIAGRPCDAKACQGLLKWTWKWQP